MELSPATFRKSSGSFTRSDLPSFVGNVRGDPYLLGGSALMLYFSHTMLNIAVRRSAYQKRNNNQQS